MKTNFIFGTRNLLNNFIINFNFCPAEHRYGNEKEKVNEIDQVHKLPGAKLTLAN